MKTKNKLEELKDTMDVAVADGAYIDLDTGDAYNHAWDVANTAIDAANASNAAWYVANTAIDASKEAINEAIERSKGH